MLIDANDVLQLPTFFMLWVGEPFFELWLCISIVAAVARSAAVLTPERKSVLVTGWVTTSK